MKVVLIGSGNVATNLGGALVKAGHDIVTVYSRSFTNANFLALELVADATDDISKVYLEADLYIIAVKDDAIDDVAAVLPKVGGLVVHTSGSKAMDQLKRGVNKDIGVFYPLQTMTKANLLDFTAIPIFVEGRNKTIEKKLEKLGHSISENVTVIDSDQRMRLHVSAVIANNFTNYLLIIAQQLLEDNKLSFDHILPLILESIAKLSDHKPNKIQTGPAIRNDNEVINSHLDFLKDYPEYHQLYSLITEGIKKHFN